MKRWMIVLLAVSLVAALASPAVAFARKGDNSGTHGPSAAKKAAVAERKAAHDTAKAARVKGGAPEESPEAPDTEASVESTGGVGAGIANALSNITRNIEKALAGIADGTRKQVPPGLIRVWQKFAGWLGIDLTTMPGAQPPAGGETTGTVEPTSTVEPTGTIPVVPAP